jgi:hypothetical protein
VIGPCKYEAVIRNEAEALAIGLRSGFANTSDAVRWADRVISAEQHPHGTICEVALAGNKRSSEVADLLDAIPGAPVHDVVMDLLIQLIHYKLDFRRTAYLHMNRAGRG